MVVTRNPAQAWKDWLTEHGPRLLMYARQWAISVADAEDLVQDAVVRLWNVQKKNQNVPPDLPFAFNTIRFCAMDYGRKQQRTKRRNEKIVELNRDKDVWFDPALEDDEESIILRNAVAELPEKLKEVISLKVWGGLTFGEVAKALEISQNTAASRYRYALEHLERKLKPLRAARNA